MSIRNLLLKVNLNSFINAEYNFYDLASEMAYVLHGKGIGKPEPTSFTDEEIKKYFGGVCLDCPCLTYTDSAIGISVILHGFKLSMQGRTHSSIGLEEHSYDCRLL